MSGRFAKFLFLILLTLAFLGTLELLRTADHKQGTLYGELNHELYNQTSLEEKTTPFAQLNGDGNGSVLDFRDVLNRLYVDQMLEEKTTPFTQPNGDSNGSVLDFRNVLNRSYVDQPLEEKTTPFAQPNGDSNGSVLDFRDVLNRSYVDQPRHVPKPWIGSYQCKDVICSEFLYKRDWDLMRRCVDKMSRKNIQPIVRPACHFMNGTLRGSVALFSYPGSGNTWLRQLLEKATGICTGEGILTLTEATMQGPEYIADIGLHMYAYINMHKQHKDFCYESCSCMCNPACKSILHSQHFIVGGPTAQPIDESIIYMSLQLM